MQIFAGDGSKPGWWAEGNTVLVGIGLASILLELWMIVEALLLLPKTRGVLELPAPPPAHARDLLDVGGL